MKIFASVATSKVFSILVSLIFSGLIGFNLIDVSEFVVHRVNITTTDASRSAFVFDKISNELAGELGKFSGLPIWKVSVAEIHDLLKQDERLESFQIKRRFPNRLEVRLLPKKPLAVVLYGASRLYPLSADGSLLPEISLAEAPDLPIIRGLKSKDDSEGRRRMVSVLSMLPEEGSFSKANVSELTHSSDKGVSLLMMNSQTKVLIGESLSEMQVNRIQQVMKYLKSRSIKGRVIDARFSKKVVVRVRKDS